MLRKNKDYQVDEVIRSLSKKGCVITLDQAITKSVKDVVMPDNNRIEEKYKQFLATHAVQVGVNAFKMGIEEAHKVAFADFQKQHAYLFQVKEVRRDVVIQPPFTINISSAYELGNGSWGKIDFLRFHREFKLMK